ncbi:hypothetical protein OG558_03115 [Kribbella sp. NBC_01510]|uniref:hypothetical protein n=1 Tax=Kribbella sp. NBC_01510 TaxID=2903581 RepID=UPI003870AE06
MANSRIGEGVTPEQLTRFFDENTVSTQAWDLVRHRVVTEYAFKIGDVPGIVVFMEADSADEGSEIVNGLPVVQQGLLTFELDPIGKTMRF